MFFSMSAGQQRPSPTVHPLGLHPLFAICLDDQIFGEQWPGLDRIGLALLDNTPVLAALAAG